MDIITLIIGGALVLLVGGFLLRLSYTIFRNLINGRKFHHALEDELDRLRLSNMLKALGINKTLYSYQTNVNDMKRQMDSCASCDNTERCDDKLATENVDITEIEFCNNEAELINIKAQQDSQVNHAG